MPTDADLAAAYRAGGARPTGEPMPAAADLAENYLRPLADLRAAVAGMTREQVVARPVAGRWSTLEVLAHLADFEPVFVERMKRILAYDSPPLAAADENLFFAALRYHDRDAAEELAVIEATRASAARLIRSLSAEQLARTGVHSTRGPQTLEQVIRSVTGHVAHHLPFVREKRAALGLPSPA
ncbi:DinB family protein [Urbifossiella limnaea]|uniref:Metal-dependent hydrolase YfiT n=1 Tax=Urbifossiella limnaea TaxID=2528023 RepID=A0A517XZN8_9BACT|nr:DinB family protein [Urbifossiella limnaea]QDU22971.1 Putative metal-dependent hydrolase YfiT [Urbifossiella limnaea]